MLLNHPHVFHLSHNAHYTEIEKFIIGIIDEVATLQVFVSNSQHTAADKFSIQSMKKEIGTKGLRVNSMVSQIVVLAVPYCIN